MYKLNIMHQYAEMLLLMFMENVINHSIYHRINTQNDHNDSIEQNKRRKLSFPTPTKT